MKLQESKIIRVRKNTYENWWVYKRIIEYFMALDNKQFVYLGSITAN